MQASSLVKKIEFRASSVGWEGLMKEGFTKAHFLGMTHVVVTVPTIIGSYWGCRPKS
jgi:hypothetical protein